MLVVVIIYHVNGCMWSVSLPEVGVDKEGTG